MPSAAVLTEPFTGSGDAMAASQGVPDFPYAVMPHPINVQTDATLRAWAEAVAPKVIRLLVK